MAVMDIIKRPFRSFDGAKWVKHYFETSADQVRYKKKDGTESDIQTALGEDSVFLLAHPVGAIYLSISSANPGTLFGGTWAAMGAGRMLVGVNSSDPNLNAAEKTGGSTHHAHTSPQHTHTVNSHLHSTGNCTLTATQIPSHAHAMNNHAHSIPVLGGYTNETGGHGHSTNATTVTNPLKVSGVTVKWASRYVKTDTEGTGHPHSSGNENMSIDIPSVGTSSSGSHSHNITTYASTTGTNNGNTSAAGGSQAHNHGNTGGSGALTTNNNAAANTGSASSFPPYITCYMWKRTA